jgi:predicted  nucleic acid-binding Zn-ribbon protein
MNHAASKRSAKRAPSTPRRRADVEALIALVSLDQGIARREGRVAASLALADRARADATSRNEKTAASRDALQRMERKGAKPSELDKQRRQLRDRERDLDRLMQMAEEAQTEAVAASADLREQCADLPVRRAAIAHRIPRGGLADYESALRRGLLPAAVATHGRVCWGCFHRLSGAITAAFDETQALVCCPHCERVLFNPDWIERA